MTTEPRCRWFVCNKNVITKNVAYPKLIENKEVSMRGSTGDRSQTKSESGLQRKDLLKVTKIPPLSKPRVESLPTQSVVAKFLALRGCKDQAKHHREAVDQSSFIHFSPHRKVS